MKADKKNNNKRLVTGLGVLLVLLGLNLIVRFIRRGDVPADTTVTLPSPVAVAPSPTSDPTGSKAAKLQKLALPTPITPGAAVVQQDSKLAIHNKLRLLRARFDEIPLPNEPPDFNIKLDLAQIDRFRWQLPPAPKPVVATETIVKLATITPYVQILGSFRVKGRDQLLIQEASQAYLVSDTDALATDTIAFERINGKTFLVRDSTGATHDLMLAKPVDEGLAQAIEVISGQISRQPVFNIDDKSLSDGEDTQL